MPNLEDQWLILPLLFLLLSFSYCRMFSHQSANLKNLSLKTTTLSILPRCTGSKNPDERGSWDSIKKVKLWRETEWKKPNPHHILYPNPLKVWNLPSFSLSGVWVGGVNNFGVFWVGVLGFESRKQREEMFVAPQINAGLHCKHFLCFPSILKGIS